MRTAAVDVGALYKVALGRLDHVGRFHDELLQLRAAKGNGNGKCAVCPNPAAGACGEDDADEDHEVAAAPVNPDEDEVETTP